MQETKASWETGPIKDLRGRSVSQLDPFVMHLLHKHDTIPPDALAVIARRVGAGLTRWNRVLLWATVVGVLCLVIALIILSTRYLSGSISSRRLIVSLVPFTFIWFTPFSLWMGTRSARFHRIRSIMLEHERCAHCGYHLRGLPVDPTDHATLCPECGCAWRLTAVHDDHATDDGGTHA